MIRPSRHGPGGRRHRPRPPGPAVARTPGASPGPILVLVLVLVLGLTTTTACRRDPAPSLALPAGPLADLVDAVGDERFTLPWLSAFPDHRACDEPERGYCPGREALSPGTRRALSRWAADRSRTRSGSERAADAPAAAVLHARGVWHLLFPPDGPADAFAALERARGGAPDDWRVRNDLAAAALLRGLSGEPLRLLDALAEAEAAVAADPEALPPRFNLALTLEELGLEDDARTAWNDLLGLGPPRAWRTEARARLERLETLEPAAGSGTGDDPTLGPIRRALAGGDGDRLATRVAAHPQEATRLAREELLRRWAAAVTAEAPRGAEHPGALLDAVRLLGAALAQATGDRFVLATAERAAALDPPERRRLAEAVLALESGRALYDAREIEAAERAFRRAERTLDGLASPLDPWIDYRLLLCAYWRQEEGVGARLRTLAEAIADDDLPILEGYALWTAGLVEVDAGRFAAGRRLYRHAIERFTTSGQPGEAALLRVLLSDIEVRLGDLSTAWSEALAAITRSRSFRSPRHLWAARDQAARLAALAGHAGAALRFQEAAFRAAAETPNPSTLSAAYAARARARTRAGDGPGARDDLERARREAARITDDGVRHRAEASILLAESRSGDGADPAATIERLGRALDRYRRIDAPVLYPELLLERARRHAESGSVDRAGRDLRDALDAMRAQSRHLDALDERLGFAAAARRAVEALLALHLEPGGDPRAVPALADLARDPLRTGPRGVDLSLDPAALPLGPGEAVVSVTVLPGRLVLWAAGDGRPSVTTVPVDDGELRRRLATAARDPVAEDLGWLYDRLLRPLGPSVTDADRLALALDRGLHGLPVAALLDASTGRHLVEETTVSVVPGIWGLVEDAGAPRSPGMPQRLALVAAPSADGAAGGASGPTRSGSGGGPARRPDRLPGVAREAATLAALYPRVRTLAPPVDPADLAAAGAWADVLHVGAHGVANPLDPDLSHLVTGPEPLYARDIRRLRLGAGPTVVLAACETGVAATGDGSGTTSLAAAFLEAGARWVIASTRAVDDAAAERLTERLHGELLAGTAPDRALRATQIHYARSGELPVREWSAYTAFYRRSR